MQAAAYSMASQTIGLVMWATLTWPQQGSDLAEFSLSIQMGPPTLAPATRLGRFPRYE